MKRILKNFSKIIIILGLIVLTNFYHKNLISQVKAAKKIDVCGYIKNEKNEPIKLKGIKICASLRLGTGNQCDDPHHREYLTQAYYQGEKGFYKVNDWVYDFEYYTIEPISYNNQKAFFTDTEYYAWNYKKGDDQNLNSAGYYSQKRLPHAADCASNQEGYGEECRCNFIYTSKEKQPTDNIKACGYLTGANNKPLANAKVTVCSRSTLFDPTTQRYQQNMCINQDDIEIITTDDQGYFETSKFIPRDAYYSVIPQSHIVSAYPVLLKTAFYSQNYYRTWNYLFGHDTQLGSEAYHAQNRSRHNADCSSNWTKHGGTCRCNFEQKIEPVN